MSWIGLLKVLLTLVDRIFTYVQERKLINAGEAQAFARQMEDVNGRVQRAQKARQDVRDNLARNPDSLHDDDGYRRD